MRSLLALSLLAVLPAVAAADDKKPAGPTPIKVVTLNRKDPVVYEKDIEPIFQNKCSFCHSGNVKEGKLDLGTFEGLMKGGKRGKSVVPGKSAESLLVKLAGKTAKPQMPPKSEEPLTPEELALIKLWIDQGAKPPTGAGVKRTVVIGLPPAKVHPVRALAVSPDKSAVAAARGNQIHVYDAGSGKHVRSLVQPGLTTPDKKPVQAAHLSLVESMAYSPDGKLIASGSFGEVILWDAQTGMVRQKLTGFADRVVALSFSPDGKLLATGGGAPTEDGEIKVFEAATGKPVADIKNGHSDTVFGVCFSPDGKKLATCGADKFVKVFEIPSGKFLKSFEGHTHHVMDVGWSGDGKLLASGGADNVVKVWDYEKGEQVRTINAHQKQVTRLLFRRGTAEFITCSGDQTVKLWNTNGGTIRNFAGSADFLYAVGISPDGAVVATGGEEGVVRLYNGANGQFVKSLLPPGVEEPKK
ncbi:MAG TPA: c-type cytochrome domain-containing protein [Gemmataceae bacterium]|nr:c-type cytochrome domain-containing protein [Gemmataceae bacterium]